MGYLRRKWGKVREEYLGDLGSGGEYRQRMQEWAAAKFTRKTHPVLEGYPFFFCGRNKMTPTQLIGPGPWLDQSLSVFTLTFAEDNAGIQGLFFLTGESPLIPVLWTVRVWNPRSARVSMD